MSPSQSPDVAKSPGGVYELDLFDLWDILWSGRWLVILIGGIATVLAVVYALLAAEVYESRVVMMPADDGKSGGGLSALAGQFGGLASLAGIQLSGGGSKSSMALEVLESRKFTMDFIQENNLLPILFPGRWDEARQGWVSEDGEGNGQPPSLQMAAVLLNAATKVKTDTISGATTLTVSWKDPLIAADWANALVRRLNNDIRARDVQEAEAAIAYLEGLLADTTNVDMRQTLYRLLESQTQTVMLARVRPDYVFRVVDPALPAEMRSRPARTIIVLLGGVLGGLIGIIAVFARYVATRYQLSRGGNLA